MKKRLLWTGRILGQKKVSLDCLPACECESANLLPSRRHRNIYIQLLVLGISHITITDEATARYRHSRLQHWNVALDHPTLAPLRC